MEDLKSKVARLLRKAFPASAKISLEDHDGIIGVIVSSDFKGMDPMERQDLLWRVLEKGLVPDEHRRVTMIAAVTPTEEIAHTSG